MSEFETRLQEVSESLPDIIDRLVFVGGGVTEILITDSAGRKPRPTEDLDCIVEVASRFEYHKIEEHLRKAGYLNDPAIPPVICRWVKGPLILDVMPTLEGILGFTNLWYKDAVAHPLLHVLPTGVSVNIIHPVYYVATKTEAFRSRGQGDFRASHDFEDIVALVNGKAELIPEMKNARHDILKAMRDFWLPQLESANMIASIKEHLDAYEDIEPPGGGGRTDFHRPPRWAAETRAACAAAHWVRRHECMGPTDNLPVPVVKFCQAAKFWFKNRGI